MVRHFCTLFNRNYLYRGLALYNSLSRHCNDFRLHILCMDDITYRILAGLDLKNVKLISLSEFEDSDLLKIKNTRTEGEYCWTCTASLLLFLLKKNKNLEMVSYLDADLLFFGDPEPIFEEFGSNSIFITEHNFSKEFQRLISNGKYNVQFLIFRNDPNAIEALEWWRRKTIEWCYNSRDGKKGGDQIYLNDWVSMFQKVHVLANKKICLAPWNVSKYTVAQREGKIYVEETELIFYHFHSFSIISPVRFNLAAGSYSIRNPLKDIVYKPYIEEIKAAIKLVGDADPSFGYGFSKITRKERIKGFIGNLIYNFLRFKNI